MPHSLENKQVSTLSLLLYLLLVIDFFMHMSGRIPGYSAFRPTLILAVLTMLSVFSQQKKLEPFSKDPIFAALIALFIYLIVSLPLVEFPGSVLRESVTNYIKAIIYFFLTIYIISSKSRLAIFLFVFISCQVFRVLEPLYLHITDGYWGDRTYIGAGEFTGRLAGAPADVINPNELGFVIVTTIPFLHYLLFRNGKFFTTIYLLLMPCMLYALILTMSRGGFLALLVVAWMIFKESKNKFFMIILAIGIAISGWSVMSPLQKDRYLSIIDSDTVGSATMDGRLNGLISEYKLAFERPIVGHGLGTTQEAKYHSYGGTYVSHSMYAEILIEIGLIGGIFFFRFIREIGRSIKRNFEKLSVQKISEDHFFYRLSYALKAIFWMYVVYSINYWGLSMYYWYLLAGLTVSLTFIIKKSEIKNKIEL
ncbi:MAG: O-antigen ligase family protein [Gammaproteobacteria bacterium]|nr:O-antigen ligase family protein [Gammaproteobacteria bacterium]